MVTTPFTQGSLSGRAHVLKAFIFAHAISDPKMAFDGTVNLYTAAEYDEWLRTVVERICPRLSALYLNALRRISPVLRAYHAKAVIVNSEGVSVYECRNHMEKIDFQR